jgi:hypothetical protein
MMLYRHDNKKYQVNMMTMQGMGPTLWFKKYFRKKWRKKLPLTAI